jgi:hypothetical protein
MSALIEMQLSAKSFQVFRTLQLLSQTRRIAYYYYAVRLLLLIVRQTSQIGHHSRRDQ